MHLMINGKPFPLWDMPTHVTCMCMTSDDSVIHYDLSGNKARAAISRYIEWVKGRLDDVFADEEEYESLRESVEKHLNELEEELEKARYVVVSAY